MPRAASTKKLVADANKWRDAYNPLRSLVMSRVVSLLEAGERGEYADLQWLYRFVEKRYPVLRALILRRRSALGKLDWDIKTVEDADETDAEAQREYLRAHYDRIGNFREAIKQLALAEFRGFTVLQLQCGGAAGLEAALRNAQEPITLHWLPQWNFVRDGQFGGWYWNPSANAVNAAALGEANKLDLSQGFIFREVDMPVNEIAAVAFLRSNLSLKDWDAFVEMFGLPGCVMEMPPNIPPGKESEYEETAAAVAESGSGAVPSGAKPHFPTAQVRGNHPFKEHLEWQEKDVVLAGTGGKLAMLTASTGLNSSQGTEHADAFDEVAQAEAMEISEVFQKQFDAPLLSAKFPGQRVLAYFELAAQDKEDVDALVDRVAKLKAAGFKLDAEEISEKVGLKLESPEAPEPQTTKADVLGGKNNADDDGKALSNRAPVNPSGDARTQLLTALAADLRPLRERLARIMQITDPEIQRQKLSALSDEIGRIKTDLSADPETARALEYRMSAVFADTLALHRAKNRGMILNGTDQPRDSLGRWVDANGGGLSEQDNIERGRNAVERALRHSTSVPKAMHRPEVNQIDFEWGRPGTSQPDAEGRTHTDGYGISHIVAKHGEAAARALPEVIGKGRIIPHDREANKRYILHGDRLAVLKRTNQTKAYVVSGFEDPEKIQTLKTKSRPSWMAGK